MKIFLDTCSLFKLYYREADTYIVENIFRNNQIDEVFLSGLTVVESLLLFVKSNVPGK